MTIRRMKNNKKKNFCIPFVYVCMSLYLFKTLIFDLIHSIDTHLKDFWRRYLPVPISGNIVAENLWDCPDVERTAGQCNLWGLVGFDAIEYNFHTHVNFAPPRAYSYSNKTFSSKSLALVYINFYTNGKMQSTTDKFLLFFLFTKLKQVCKLSEFTSNTSNKCQNESLQALRKNAVKMTIKDSDV